MSEETKTSLTGTVALSFLAGAALGISMILLLKKKHEEEAKQEYNEGPLFI